jgi:hypothetical protein
MKSIEESYQEISKINAWKMEDYSQFDTNGIEEYRNDNFMKQKLNIRKDQRSNYHHCLKQLENKKKLMQNNYKKNKQIKMKLFKTMSSRWGSYNEKTDDVIDSFT